MIEIAIAVCVTFVLGGGAGTYLAFLLLGKSFNTEQGRDLLFAKLFEKASAKEIQKWRSTGWQRS